MKTFFLFCIVNLSVFSLIAQNEVDIHSKKQVWAHLESQKFAAEDAGDYPMFVQLEKISSEWFIVISNDNGKRKLFSNVEFTDGDIFSLITGKGVEGGDLDLQIHSDGRVVTSGMTFKAIK